MYTFHISRNVYLYSKSPAAKMNKMHFRFAKIDKLFLILAQNLAIFEKIRVLEKNYLNFLYELGKTGSGWVFVILQKKCYWPSTSRRFSPFPLLTH